MSFTSSCHKKSFSAKEAGMYIVQRVCSTGGGGENRPWAFLGKKIGPEYMKILAFSLFFRH